MTKNHWQKRAEGDPVAGIMCPQNQENVKHNGKPDVDSEADEQREKGPHQGDDRRHAVCMNAFLRGEPREVGREQSIGNEKKSFAKRGPSEAEPAVPRSVAGQALPGLGWAAGGPPGPAVTRFPRALGGPAAQCVLLAAPA